MRSSRASIRSIRLLTPAIANSKLAIATSVLVSLSSTLVILTFNSPYFLDDTIEFRVEAPQMLVNEILERFRHSLFLQDPSFDQPVFTSRAANA